MIASKPLHAIRGFMEGRGPRSKCVLRAPRKGIYSNVRSAVRKPCTHHGVAAHLCHAQQQRRTFLSQQP